MQITIMTIHRIFTSNRENLDLIWHKPEMLYEKSLPRLINVLRVKIYAGAYQ